MNEQSAERVVAMPATRSSENRLLTAMPESLTRMQDEANKAIAARRDRISAIESQMKSLRDQHMQISNEVDALLIQRNAVTAAIRKIEDNK